VSRFLVVFLTSCQLAGGIGLGPKQAPPAPPTTTNTTANTTAPTNPGDPPPTANTAPAPADGGGLSRITVPALPGSARDSTMIVMPTLKNMNRAQAEAAVRKAGMKGEIEFEFNDGPARSTEVCRQSPSEGGQSMAHLSVSITMCTPDVVHEQPVLAGLSPAAATAKAKASGFTGKIEVLPLSEYDASCKADTVCRVTPFRWEINQDPSMQLWVNKKVAITVPD